MLAILSKLLKIKCQTLIYSYCLCVMSISTNSCVLHHGKHVPDTINIESLLGLLPLILLLLYVLEILKVCTYKNGPFVSHNCLHMT